MKDEITQYALAKAKGFNPKIMISIVRLRSTRQEADLILETYKTAIGLD